MFRCLSLNIKEKGFTVRHIRVISTVCSSRALQGWRVNSGSRPVRTAGCGLFEARECCGFEQGGSLSSLCLGELRAAPAGWCETGEGSGPQHGRPDGATALSDSARFLAASPAPAQWLPGSDEGQSQGQPLTPLIK